MQLALPLKDMTTLDKLRTIEAIWEDLCRNPESVPSPTWHAEVLRSRSAAVRAGSRRFTAWDEAKKRVRAAAK